MRKVPNIKILVAYHKPAKLFKNDVFVPIHLGRALATKDGSINEEDYQWMLDNMIGDDTGDNISHLNRYFNELTAVYWAWKNYDKLGNPDYIGLTHYRRHFLFEKENLSDIETFPYVNEDYLSLINPQNIDGDFVAPRRSKWSISVYKQYEQSPYHNIDDLNKVISLLGDKYPYIEPIAKKYLNSDKSYFYNMFIMKKDVFFGYCQYIFDILFSFYETGYYECRSYEESRLFVSERLTGIYISYLYSKKYKGIEYPVGFLEYTDIPKQIKPVFSNVPSIVFSLNNEYISIFSVCFESLLQNISQKNRYDICILDEKISPQNKHKLLSMCPSNVSLRFIDILPYIHQKGADIFKVNKYYNITTYYRFFIAEIFTLYQETIYFDADTVFQSDPAELYNYDLGKNWVAATRDLYMPLWIYLDSNMKKYIEETLNMPDTSKYFQAGVMIFNIQAFIKYNIKERLLETLKKVGQPVVVDQDILNSVCYNNVAYLDNKWNFDRNLELLKEDHPELFSHMKSQDKKIYMTIRNHYSLIHYAGPIKPWKNPEIPYAYIWWHYARMTPFYEEIIYKNTKQPIPKSPAPVVSKEMLSEIFNYTKNKHKYWKYKILSKITFGKKRKKYKQKRKDLKARLKVVRRFLKGK